MKTNKSDPNLDWVEGLDLPVEVILTETGQSTPSFSIDVEMAKNMVSGTCIFPSGSRDFVICKEGEKIKIFKIVRKKDTEESIPMVQPEVWKDLSGEK